ncbi:hypothetical protein ACFCW2_04940 [Qipengyuania sp. DSG2-2]|uniref:hypothetical protein n=1 Tax=Qipengyuania sp. DGS2-2 TaxID=3349631 RepID=UPI0036D239EC
MSGPLESRILQAASRSVRGEVAAFGQALAEEAGANAVLFYGSNLRTGSLDGVLDFYLLHDGPQRERIWPRVSYHEMELDGETLRAKAATMSIGQFTSAARGDSRDTTIWARFVQPSALIWAADEATRDAVLAALSDAGRTAARAAAALGPESGAAADFWRALFQATYTAEFRVEKAGREDSILSVNAEHFEGLLPAAWAADGLAFSQDGETLAPRFAKGERQRILAWWRKRQRLGKALNLLRLAKATTTFEGAARYGAWKVERHTGVALEVTPFAERYPLLAAPGALFRVLRAKRSAKAESPQK